MGINELKALHDRATRGEALSADERARLNDWYAAEDKLEDQTLGQTPAPNCSDDLRKKTEEVFARLSVVTQQTQKLIAQNEALRQENDHLRQQLAQPPTTQAA